ncbi:conserved Plasmodium protein, unknown function [Plasmodium ovale curtisi]|uniref:Uncharacterized protein n=2 Tax=Plasmodium ovale TaxID=36330 RepID=A0A1A8WYM6_PLAOA|nr:conserved Plasmodium protein, unknown function [Plasmodium ovale curtisi]
MKNPRVQQYNMKEPSFTFLPHKLIPTSKYNDVSVSTSVVDANVKRNNGAIYEYCNSKFPPTFATSMSSPTPVYSEKVIYTPSVIKSSSVVPTYNLSGGNQRKMSCLNSFPCLSGNSKASDKMNARNFHVNNKNIEKRSNNIIPYFFNGKPITTPDGFERMCNDTTVIPVTFDSPVYGGKYYIHPDSREIVTKLGRSHVGNKQVGEKDTGERQRETDGKGKLNYAEPFKKRVLKEKPLEKVGKNKVNELIREKDEEIKELEKTIKREKLQNEVEYSDLDNNKLREKLLDQKIKYEETLKHLKKVESEKRTLKSSLHVRDKVLAKLENEIGSVDDENNFLRKVRENGIKDFHGAFMYLHDREEVANKGTEGNCRSGDSEEDKGKEDVSWYKTRSTSGDIIPLSSDVLETSDMKCEKKENNCVQKTKADKKDMYSLKSTIVELEKEIHDLREDNKNVHFKYENTFQALSELRKDTLEYMESIVSRDMRIGYMESMLQKCERDLTKVREQFKKEQIKYREKIDKFQSEMTILEKQSSHLQSMIHEKDSQIVLLKSEIVRNEILVKQYEERNKELQNELKLMCNNLENVIDASNKKDLFMNELEKQIRENEVHRQNAYLKEVAKNRKIHANMKFKEILYDKSAKHQVDELHNLKKELYLNKIQMQKAKDAFEVLKNAPKTDSITVFKGDVSAEYDKSTVHNSYEYKNEKSLANTTFEAKVSTDAGTACKPKNLLAKKKKREVKVNAQAAA